MVSTLTDHCPTCGHTPVAPATTMSHIVVVLDRSGSMATIRADMEGGLNQFIKDQKKVPGECFFTLVQFDTEDPFEVVYSYEPLHTVRKINLTPRGGTPLLDALGKTLSSFRSRPAEKKAVVVITDGQENSSHEWSRAAVRQLVTDMTAEGWQFTYLGANQDAFAEAGQFGIPLANVMNFAATSYGTASMAGSLSSNMASYRGGQADDLSYSQEQQEDAGRTS